MREYHLSPEAERRRRTWYSRNRKDVLARRRARYKADPHAIRRANRKRYGKFRGEYLKRSRESRLKREYGLTSEGFNTLLRRQKNRCAICSKPALPGKVLQVDHCHKTGKVRGLVHGKCNTAFGLLDESLDKIRRLLTYAEKWSDKVNL